jgi:putative peptidoglycan lipid II flippase
LLDADWAPENLLHFRHAKLAVVILAAVTTSMMLLRFSEQWLLARALGAGPGLDAYFLGQIVLLLGGQLAVAVTSTAVPLLSSVDERDRPAAALQLCRITIVWVATIFALLAVFSGPVMNSLQRSLDPRNERLAQQIFLWLLPATAACIVAALLRAYWHANGNFCLPGIGQLFVPVCTCGGAALVAIGVWNLRYAAAAANLGAILLAVLLYLPLLRRDEPSSSDVRTKLGGIGRRFGAAFVPVAASLALIPAMVAASRSFASRLAPGSVTAVSLAASLASIPGQIAAASIGMVLLPQMAQLLAAGRAQEAARMVGRCLRTSAFIVIPCAVFSLLCAREAIDLVFRRGAFNASAVHATAAALAGYSIGLPALASMQVLTFALLGAGCTRRIALTTVCTLLLDLVLTRCLLPFGLTGVAAAFSLACFFNAGVLLDLLASSLPELRPHALLISHLRIVAIAAVACGLARALTMPCNLVSEPLLFVATLCLAAGLYLGLSHLAGSPEMTELFTAAHRRRQNIVDCTTRQEARP